FTAPSVKALRGLKHLHRLLATMPPVETTELLFICINEITYDDEDEPDPYSEFGKNWNVTRLLDEEEDDDKLCKEMDRAIAGIGKACSELGRYFHLVVQRPAINGEGWLIEDKDPGDWVLDATPDHADASMSKVGDTWHLRWFEGTYSVRNERVGLEYAARIL